MNTGERKHIEVVAAVICDGNRIFATQRGYGEWKDWWEFPGGRWSLAKRPKLPCKRDTRGAGNGYLSGKPPHHSLLRLPQLPPNHALLPLQGQERQPHSPRTRGSQVAHARRAGMCEVAAGWWGSGDKDKGLIWKRADRARHLGISIRLLRRFRLFWIYAAR